MKHSKVLTAAAKLLTQKTWCQGFPAFNAKGEGVYPNEPEAVEWCLLGACCKILDLERPYQLGKDLLGYIGDGIWATDVGWNYGGDPTPSAHAAAISAWNDGQVSFGDVRKALLAAAEFAERDEGHD